VRLLIMID